MNPAPSKSSLSPVERSRLYHQLLRTPGCSLKIKISEQHVNTLVKRGYLGPDELHDGRAIGQAASLFFRDALLARVKLRGRKKVGRLVASRR
jgi:hypothetical protein